MTYQALARKWRPKSFENLVGQEHVSRALINALDHNRLHHAYLFTGTRGVGKTTIARILAKCLNCEKGIGSQPCNECKTCQEVDAGRFIDLIEVDAASRTRVEDTRELLENVQYAPSSGRYKVYLIDEVHMLSGHSFNALLKTLEEPPEHVKFLLATTDPQKLPVTVLSRCLQFNLKHIAPELIIKNLESILNAEKISFEPEALKALAHAANGSMRDALSLLDQAIAYGKGEVNTAQIHEMLGTIEHTHIEDLLNALIEHNAEQLIAITAHLAEQSTDFQQALEALLTTFHEIALAQSISLEAEDKINYFATAMSKEDIHLFYQIALVGKKDLPLAPSPRIGFEMILLRMLDFRLNADIPKPQVPKTKNKPDNLKKQSSSEKPAASSSEQESQPQNAPADSQKNCLTETDNEEVDKPEKTTTTENTLPPLSDKLNWAEIIGKLNLSGMAVAFANNCQLISIEDELIELNIASKHIAFASNKQQKQLEDALSAFFQKPIKLKVKLVEIDSVESPAKLVEDEKQRQHEKAKQSLETDPAVAYLLESFNATLDNSSIAFSKETQ